MSIIDLILQRRQCQGKDRKVTLLPACTMGPYHYCSKFQTLCMAVFTPYKIL